ncbi:MAG: carbohydrate ABC transporter permease [Bacteroidota bacterium]
MDSVMTRDNIGLDIGPGRSRGRRMSPASRLAVYAMLTIGAITMLAPLWWTFVTSLSDPMHYFTWPPRLWPRPTVWHNYVSGWTQLPFNQWLLNTLILAALCAVGGILANATVGYAFAYFRFPGRDFLFFLMLATMLIPGQIQMVPKYVIWAKLRMLNTWWPLWLPAFFAGPFNVFFYRQYLLSQSVEMLDSAEIDGAGPVATFTKIVLPLCRPINLIMALWYVNWKWTDWFEPFLYLTDWMQKGTVALGLQVLRYKGGIGLGQIIQWGPLLAVSLLLSIPPLIFYALVQGRFVQTFVFTGQK